MEPWHGQGTLPGPACAQSLRTSPHLPPSAAFCWQIKNKKFTFALVCESLKYHAVLDSVLHEARKVFSPAPLIARFGRMRARSQIKALKKLWPELVRVMLYDLLLGRGKIQARALQTLLLSWPRSRRETDVLCRVAAESRRSC
jgi:hypothetical protein